MKKKHKDWDFVKTWEKINDDEKDIDLADLGRRISRMDNPLARLGKQARNISKRFLRHGRRS